MTYTIETRPADSDDDRDWTTDGIGDANTFDSADGAWYTIGELQRMGDDWAGAQYRVVDSDGATVGTLPESISLEDPEGVAFVEMLKGLRGPRSGGAMPFGASVRMLESLGQNGEDAGEAASRHVADAYLDGEET